MDFLELKEIESDDASVFYRQRYKAIAVFKSDATGQFQVPIHFIIETDALSNRSVFVQLKEGAKYPSIPLINILKDKILDLHSQGIIHA